MRLSCLSLGLGVLLAACSPRSSAPSAGEQKAATAGRPVALAASADTSTFADIIARSTPSVVLLLNTHADSSMTFGAGFLVGPGLVLTSEHVVASAKKLGVMLYKAGRTSYTPMDGGLSRFLFENQGDIRDVREVAGDATSDIALMQLDADTSGYPTLPMGGGEVKAGDRVIALGHPQELVWSFTQGMVGTIQQGAIQHDAAISFGSSGGPLLNLRGEIVGINVAKVVSESPGLSFARPIALAGRYFAPVASLVALDLSTPEAAALSCWRAQEIGRLETGDCFDWDTSFTVFRSIAEDALGMVLPAEQERLRAEIMAPDFRDRWIEDGKRHAAAYFVSGPTPPMDNPALGVVPAELARAKDAAAREDEIMLREHPDLRGLYADRKTPALLQARLRLGIRVERTFAVDDHRAWVELAGRNPDGSIYRFSEFYVKIGQRWLQRLPPLTEDMAALPRPFAPSLCTPANYRAGKLDKLLREPESLRALRVKPPVVPVPVVKKSGPGACTAALCAGKTGGST
ncbi:MAG TPA: trypsin-like peptidase domain-containing protein [Polyangiaceae bacterium]|nr:trypsin-like peptidase domain-containing protein [Polyangiaceae bacterium]